MGVMTFAQDIRSRDDALSVVRFLLEGAFIVCPDLDRDKRNETGSTSLLYRKNNKLYIMPLGKTKTDDYEDYPEQDRVREISQSKIVDMFWDDGNRKPLRFVAYIMSQGHDAYEVIHTLLRKGR